MVDNSSDEFFPVKSPPDPDDLVQIRNSTTNSPFGARTDGPWFVRVGDLAAGGQQAILVEMGTSIKGSDMIELGALDNTTFLIGFHDDGGLVNVKIPDTAFSGGGSVSITAVDQNIVVTPSPITGTGTVGTGTDLIHIDSVTSEVNHNLLLQTPNSAGGELNYKVIINPGDGTNNGSDGVQGGEADIFGGNGGNAIGVNALGSDGGPIFITAGNGGLSTGTGLPGSGGNVSISGGTATTGANPGSPGGPGGFISLLGGTPGTGTATQDGGFGGDISLTANVGGNASGGGNGGRGGDITLALNAGGTGAVAGRHGLAIVSGMVTVDPIVADALWDDNGTVRFSGAPPLSGGSAIVFPQVDKGTVVGGTVTFDAASAKQRLQVGGALTIATSNWPAAGNYGEIEIELVNGGSAAITWPTVKWMVGDGTNSGTFATMGVTLQAADTNFVNLWSTDAGATVYGRAI